MSPVRTPLAIACLLLGGCTDTGTRAIEANQPRFDALRGKLAPLASSLLARPIPEVLGGPLDPPIVIADDGNTQFLSLWGWRSDVSPCVSTGLDRELAAWMSLTERDSLTRYPTMSKRGAEVRPLREAAARALAARYVVFYRMRDCSEPDSDEGSATIEAFVVDTQRMAVVRNVRVTIAPDPPNTLAVLVHDRLLGALAGRAGVTVKLPSLKDGNPAIVPLTTPEPPYAPPPKPVKWLIGTRCTIEAPEGSIDDKHGEMSCDEAEKLAKHLRAAGFAAKVVGVAAEPLAK